MHALILSVVIASQGAGFEGNASSADAGYCEACDSGCAGGGCSGAQQGRRCSNWVCGPMPQTCYAPRYGCYPGNNRFMNRYPAFHGSYYRRPYNYRNVFDYPWHAELHEPTSLFAYNVSGEDNGEDDGDGTFDFGAAAQSTGHSFGDHPSGARAGTVD
ncbi:MAG: hypothetical protein R3C10_05455 [Pirellulales bacterium]|nr:hypothetical protein [Planctomycetales bacterium]